MTRRSLLHYTPLLALALCVSCANQPGGPVRQDEAPTGSDYPTHARQVRYQCDGGRYLETRFFPQEQRAVLVREERRMELQQRRSASGYIYSNGPTTIRGKGNELILEDRGEVLRCQARINERSD